MSGAIERLLDQRAPIERRLADNPTDPGLHILLAKIEAEIWIADDNAADFPRLLRHLEEARANLPPHYMPRVADLLAGLESRGAPLRSLISPSVHPGLHDLWRQRSADSDSDPAADTGAYEAVTPRPLSRPPLRPSPPPAGAEEIDVSIYDFSATLFPLPPRPQSSRPQSSGSQPSDSGRPLNPVAESVDPDRFENYRIVRRLASGGMGTVYEAEQLNPRRRVALKVIKAEAINADLLRRFDIEVQVLGKLDHPGIARIYEAGTFETPEGRLPFFAMEFIDGLPLTRFAEKRGLDSRGRLELMADICDAAAHAHSRGVIHRDLKPDNILIDEQGRPHILDFGLARVTDADIQAASVHTAVGQIMGTINYMSPEQTDGVSERVGHRSDIYSLGVILFELLAGRLPYDMDGKSIPERLLLIIEGEPSRITSFNREFRGDVDTIISHALEREPARRYGDAAELAADIRRYLRDEPILARKPGAGYQMRKFIRRNRIGLAAAAASLLLVGVGGWITVRTEKSSRERIEEQRAAAEREMDRVRWARSEALPRARALAAEKKIASAFVVASQAAELLPDDPALAALVAELSVPVNVLSDPPGASVSVRDYSDPKAEWRKLGSTPLEGVRLARDFLLWRVEKEGCETLEAGRPTDSGEVAFLLDREGELPPGMVRVPAASHTFTLNGLDRLGPVALGEYFIDVHEVSNAEFRKFIDAGGYERPEYWKHEFIRDGEEIPWEEAVSAFTDRSGMRGPTGWSKGAPPEGEEDLPVAGVSWFEAAAFAEFAGKSLPTVYHWAAAAETGNSRTMMTRANFMGRAALPVGASGARGPWGTYDMAGNVNEWCSTATGTGEDRYALGGAFPDQHVLFGLMLNRDPFKRVSSLGFRCVRYADPAAIPKKITDPFLYLTRDFRTETPVSDEVFRFYLGQFRHDPVPLRPELEATEDDNPAWRMEKITIAAAYGGERLPFYLCIPKRGEPPFRTTVFFADGPGFEATSSDEWIRQPGVQAYIHMIVTNKTCVMMPVLKSTFERRDSLRTPWPAPTAAYREHVIQWVQDVTRCVDYLETRPEVCDPERISFAGGTWGSMLGPIIMAAEKRLSAGVWSWAGLLPVDLPPEIDPFHYVSRVEAPVLIIYSDHWPIFPLETSVEPMFELLATPPDRKILFKMDPQSNALNMFPVIKALREFMEMVAPEGDGSAPGA